MTLFRLLKEKLVKYENRHVGSLNLFILSFRVSGGINRPGQTYGGGGVDAQPRRGEFALTCVSPAARPYLEPSKQVIGPDRQS
jgi:hypothetical protein